MFQPVVLVLLMFPLLLPLPLLPSLALRLSWLVRLFLSVEDDTGELVAIVNRRARPERFTVRDILLVANDLAGAKQHIKTSVFGFLNQLAILQIMPADLTGIPDMATDQASSDGLWRDVLEEYFHQPCADRFARL
jgi:hypothetical protein